MVLVGGLHYAVIDPRGLAPEGWHILDYKKYVAPPELDAVKHLYLLL